MELPRYFINNRPYRHDADTGVFNPEDGQDRPLTLLNIMRAGKSLFITNHRAVDIDGGLFFEDTPSRMYRMAEPPFTSVPFAEVLPVEQGGQHRISPVGGKELVRRMASIRKRLFPREIDEEMEHEED